MDTRIDVVMAYGAKRDLQYISMADCAEMKKHINKENR
jgi:hypothetical protein